MISEKLESILRMMRLTANYADYANSGRLISAVCRDASNASEKNQTGEGLQIVHGGVAHLLGVGLVGIGKANHGGIVF